MLVVERAWIGPGRPARISQSYNLCQIVFKIGAQD